MGALQDPRVWSRRLSASTSICLALRIKNRQFHHLLDRPTHSIIVASFLEAPSDGLSYSFEARRLLLLVLVRGFSFEAFRSFDLLSFYLNILFSTARLAGHSFLFLIIYCFQIFPSFDLNMSALDIGEKPLAQWTMSTGSHGTPATDKMGAFVYTSEVSSLKQEKTQKFRPFAWWKMNSVPKCTLESGRYPAKQLARFTH